MSAYGHLQKVKINRAREKIRVKTDIENRKSKVADRPAHNESALWGSFLAYQKGEVSSDEESEVEEAL